jgi:hypothetical protein
MADSRITGLRDRTTRRDRAIWQSFDLLGLGLPDYEELENFISVGGTKQFLAMVDAELDASIAQRNLLHEADLAEIAQDRKNALAKIETQRKALAIKHAADLLVLAAREYDAKVKQFIMAAREYAAEVEKEQVELERLQAELAVKKAELHGQDIYARVFFELVEQKQLEAEKAKTEVEVARANIRALTAEIEAEQAELRVIQEELEVVMTEAEKATLNSDIAMIIADITTRCLAGIRLGVEKAEIQESREYIQQHLDDMLHLWERRALVENIRRDAELSLQAEVWRLLEEQKALEALKVYNAQSDLMVANKEVEIILQKAKEEGYDRYSVGLARAIAIAARSRAKIQINLAESQAKIDGYAAQEKTYQNAVYEDNYRQIVDQTIVSG